MIYVDTSVALAAVFAEDRRPPASFWAESLVSSRLLDYEMHVRCHARGASAVVGPVLARVGLVELAPAVLERARQPFPFPVRTLDALHLATVLYLHAQGQKVWMASYDARMCTNATALGLQTWPALG